LGGKSAGHQQRITEEAAMKRFTMIAAVAMLAFAASAHASSYFGFQIGVSNAPPPPRFRFYHRPPIVIVPDTRVYEVEDADLDCDMFSYGPYWYAYRDGYWYRGRDYDGPFRVVDVRYVPRPILVVPRDHWRHREWESRPAYYTPRPEYRPGRYRNRDLSVREQHWHYDDQGWHDHGDRRSKDHGDGHDEDHDHGHDHGHDEGHGHGHGKGHGHDD
jgi:hypothetical protein